MILGIAAVLASLLYLLYRQGFAVTKSIAAVLFVFRVKRNGSRASLNTCTGWVRYVRARYSAPVRLARPSSPPSTLRSSKSGQSPRTAAASLWPTTLPANRPRATYSPPPPQAGPCTDGRGYYVAYEHRKPGC